MTNTPQNADSMIERSSSQVGGVVLFSAEKQGRSTSRDGKKRWTTDGAIVNTHELANVLKAQGVEVHRVSLSKGQSKRQREFESNVESARKAIRRACSKASNEDYRIGIVAEGTAAEAAVIGAAATGHVSSIVLLSGKLSRQGKDLLSEWAQVPVLCVVNSGNKPSFRDMTDVFFESSNSDSDIRIPDAVADPDQVSEQDVRDSIVEWIKRSFAAVGTRREIILETEDGWHISGNLLIPDANGQAPGVVLLHSGRSDRNVYERLERLLVRAGMAVLNIDWRGRGKSTNKGKYFDLSKEEKAAGKLDAKAAIDYLAQHPSVDGSRIGLVGVIHGAEHAVRGSIDDNRVKALAILTGYVPADETERQYITRGDVSVLYVTSEGHRQVTPVMRGLHNSTSTGKARLRTYPGGAIGYQLFELDETLEPFIVEWMREELSR